MENEGYEEDHSRPDGEQSSFETSNRNQLHAVTIDGDSSIATHPDGHVYEDISTDAEKGLEFSETSFDKSRSSHENKSLRLSDATKAAWLGRPSSIVSPTIDRYFENDSALCSSAGISANCESPISPSLAAPTAIEDARSGLSTNSCGFRRDVPESASSRENEDSARDASTVQSDRRPNRRRRKKDCKHCRNKLTSASSCEKLNEPADTKDAILGENASKHPDEEEFNVANLLLQEPFLHSQNLKIYPVASRTSLRGIVTAGKGSSAFPAYSENGLGNANATLPNVMNDEMFGQVADSNRSKMYRENNGVLINGIDMRINSIYSQERWYGKELPVFYTDVKDQSPFQVSHAVLKLCSIFLPVFSKVSRMMEDACARENQKPRTKYIKFLYFARAAVGLHKRKNKRRL